ncbi:hypothetical protein [Mesorhizobium sp.]|uniref:hypothetical protein n=1 Tax=Mesorhizobium sp. TaxID=1871066 RepID=UPI000FE2D9A1|nr:hypothetical protein [Mesorhizobium sp.]RWA62464.1 MAG: hypothetical protein EOQ28_31055 [Mesorhizobium sp.]RWB94261.1 MAG: hypothetical protein EOQ57_32225 [Mesorhizobium sp.]RWG78183.1 MAG: hypothetical protein EOQ69_27175 [Mesorhizobium sp.]RWG90853.1 MAG: hypothetical protein EOQ70_03955 [Mesorhizobium sp.]RWK04162.1 MAG: hypothetical protein EOR39_29410 [Mesorhizobium sp.]
MTNSWLRYTGFIVPPLAWALSTQLGQITPYIDCRQTIPWTAAVCGILLVASIAGVAASRATSTGLVKSKRFVVDTGFLIALAFVFALSLQEAATMLLDSCQR